MKIILKYKKDNMILNLLFLVIFMIGCTNTNVMENEFSEFLKKYEEKAIPLATAYNSAYFKASISGMEEDYNKVADLNFEQSKLHSDKNDFELLKRIKESKKVKDPILERQLIILYNIYLAKQVEEDKLKEIIDLESKIEKTFSTFRTEIGGIEYSDNKIDSVLRNSISSIEVEKDIIELAKKRNAIARELDFNNFHEMKLKLSEQDPGEIIAIFDELDSLTRDIFSELKLDIDNYLCEKFSITEKELLPWHYQNKFFQEGMVIYNIDFDKYYKNQDVVAVSGKYYTGIGLQVDDIISRSDLYEKPGKNQHAYCTDIDRVGDVRILCNIRANHYWMNTMLHELGHGVYSKYHDRDMPYLLKDAAHTFTTEAIANFFGRLASNSYWINKNIGVNKNETDKIAEKSYKSLKLQQLIFSRWSQVMFRFEKSFYENPNQNLNTLWWDLVENYQMLKKPDVRDEPDWASKIHIASYPCYYHNYLLGELLASQIYFHIANNILQGKPGQLDYSNNVEIGEFLKKNIFKPGAFYEWNDMIEKATGEKLTAKYYSKQFIK